jgi:hypothetical protein
MLAAAGCLRSGSPETFEAYRDHWSDLLITHYGEAGQVEAADLRSIQWEEITAANKQERKRRALWVGSAITGRWGDNDLALGLKAPADSREGLLSGFSPADRAAFEEFLEDAALEDADALKEPKPAIQESIAVQMGLAISSPKRKQRELDGVGPVRDFCTRHCSERGIDFDGLRAPFPPGPRSDANKARVLELRELASEAYKRGATKVAIGEALGWSDRLPVVLRRRGRDHTLSARLDVLAETRRPGHPQTRRAPR